jgi:chemosensory pili system protein ChpA (sensor histidine kinase/response regulator)
MSAIDPAERASDALADLRAAFVAAQLAPPAPTVSPDVEEDQGDIATPRAKAASALEAGLRGRLEWCWEQDDRDGEHLCRVLMEMCAWHEHADLRERILSLQQRGIALLVDGPLSPSAVGEIEDEYRAIKPREDDAAAIAAALGMSLEEARSFGLVGTLSGVGIDDETPVPVLQGVGGEALAEPEEEEDLETLFRREAMITATKTLPQSLKRLWGDQQSMDAMITVRRGFHTLKGDARVTAQSAPPAVAEELEGLAVLSEAAEDIIDYLLGDDYDASQPAPGLPAGAFSLLNEAATAIVSRLEIRSPLANEPALLRRLEGMQRKAAAQSGTPIDDASLAAKIPMPPAPRPKAARGAAPKKAPADSLWPTFLEEVARLMPDLHRALGVLSKNPADETALVRARVKLHTLKGGAALVGGGALPIEAIAHSAEDLLELIEDFQLRGEMSEVPREVLDGVLDAEDALQSLVDALTRTGSFGRGSSQSQLMAVSPDMLSRRLDDIAERVRRGDLVAPAAAEPVTAEVPAAPPPVPAPSTQMVAPVAKGPGKPDSEPSEIESDLLHRVVPQSVRTRAMASVGLRQVHLRDITDRSGRAEVRGRVAVFDRMRALEDRARQATGSFVLFIGLQHISQYVAEQARYRDLAGPHGQIYILGMLDTIPTPEARITIVPLENGDALLSECFAIFDATEYGGAFIAYDITTDLAQAGRRFRGVAVDDPALVREVSERLIAALRQDTALVAVRRVVLQDAEAFELVPLPRQRNAAPAADQPRGPRTGFRPAAEYGKEYSLQTALRALEDLSVTRDALAELVSRMTRQSIESRRSGRRLRTLVERVGTELAGLRSELVRTNRRTGDWDLLEKEEYSTIDVLLMQLDEALADLEESDTSQRRDLGEARAQVESQADNQLRAQRVLLDMSMIPLSQLEDRLNHVVRSQSRRLGKQVTFKMEGGELQLDGRIAESLFEPLLHLINNALDHGIEETSGDRVSAGKTPSGHLIIRGRTNGDGVAIEVIDDGRGIDPERVAAVAVSRNIVSASEAAAMSDRDRMALIWRPGFSTARSLTTLSGRGMGMKSVQDEITSLQGRIEIASRVGQGTTFTISLPRSLAMMRVEVVREGRDLIAVPITQVVATHPLPYRRLSALRAGQTVEIGGRALTLYGAHLAAGPVGDGEAGQSIVLEVAGRAGGLVVDEVMGSQYLPVRAAPGYLRRHCGVLGYAVGGGGRILPILDLPTLIDRSGSDTPVVAVEQTEQPAYTVLVVDDSQTMRRALRSTLAKAGFRIREAADGREALTICAAGMPDLITLDMEMPGMDGLEALSALRLLPAGGATVPVFMITSRQQARHRAAALAAGVTRYFTKPYDQDELVGAAQLVLARGAASVREAAS